MPPSIRPLPTAAPSIAPTPVPPPPRRAPAPAAVRAFLDVAVDGEPVGRVTVKLYDDVPLGAARFADLARDVDGVGYRNSRVDGVRADEEVRCSGVASLAYRADAAAAVAGGDTVEGLLPELAAARHSSAAVGAVSLVVTDPTIPPPDTRLVAINGKLVTVERPTRAAPNGTAFVVTLAPAPELDATNLVVGEVESGLADVLVPVSRLKASQPTNDSPFFKIAKKIGDKRADVAEKYFRRPFARVIIRDSGVLE